MALALTTLLHNSSVAVGCRSSCKRRRRSCGDSHDCGNRNSCNTRNIFLSQSHKKTSQNFG